MDLEGQRVVFYLTPEGFRQLNFLLRREAEDSGAGGIVINTDWFGMWVSVAGEREPKILGFPGHYLRAIEVEPEAEPGAEARKTIGFVA